MKRLLLVEDEEVILKALVRLLERNHFVVETATTVDQALQLQPQSFDLVLADLRLPGDEGTSIIPCAEPVPVVIMTSHASVRSAVDAMRHGAIDYIAKPFDHDELLMVIDRALMQNMMQAQNRALRLDLERIQPVHRHIAGTALEPLTERFIDLKDSQRFLHFHGERGTDREGLARHVHALSNRCDAPFVVADFGIDSAPEDAIALLGGDGIRSTDGLPPGGLLQAAHNGTLVLRHPEHLAIDTQRRLAETLQQSAVTLSESGRKRSIDVRAITIGHLSIEQLQESGELAAELADLFSHDQFAVPPLRERRDDILPLARQHLRAMERRHGYRKLKLTRSAEAVLCANDWPGNVTELDNVLTRALFVAKGSTIDVDDLGFGHGAETVSQAVASHGSRDLSLDEYFRYFVLSNQASLSETDLAARLGISRKALWERRQKMGLLRDTGEDVSP